MKLSDNKLIAIKIQMMGIGLLIGYIIRLHRWMSNDNLTYNPMIPIWISAIIVLLGFVFEYYEDKKRPRRR